jgi:hypothetical protein
VCGGKERSALPQLCRRCCAPYWSLNYYLLVGGHEEYFVADTTRSVPGERILNKSIEIYLVRRGNYPLVRERGVDSDLTLLPLRGAEKNIGRFVRLAES